MAKEDVVAAKLLELQTAEVASVTAALGDCYDAGVASVVPVSGGFTQADIDAAVAAAKATDAAAVASLKVSIESLLSAPIV